jgi:hypothetical protein
MLRMLIIFSFLYVDCWGQQPCILQGSVADLQTRELLPGANVRSMNNLQIGVNTDSNGFFELKISAKDTLVITFVGYEEQKIPVNEALDCRIHVLLKGVTNSIREVEIKGERIISEEFTIHKIRKLEIYTNPSAKADPILAVNSTPSATTTDESANISLRGGSPAETGIFLNNVPINDAVRYSQLNGIGTFSVFNTALINNVGVYPGNPPLEYGNSTSGLIALQTDETIPNKTTNMLSLTLANLGFYRFSKLSEKSSLTLFTNYQPSSPIRSVNAKALKDLKLFSSADLGLHYVKKLAPNTIIKFFNYTLTESYRFYYPQPSYDGDFFQHKVRNFTVGNIRKRIGSTEISFNQGASFSKANYLYSTTDINLSLFDLYASLNIQHMETFSEWKTGVSYDHRSSAFKGTFPTFEFAVGEKHPVSQAASDDHVSNPEWYGYYKRYLGTKWIVGGGIRKNIIIEKNKNYLSLQGNIHFKPDTYWDINFSAGQYHKYQLPQEGSSEPSLMKSNQYSLDLSYSRTSWTNSASIFYKSGNVDDIKTTTKGMELFSRFKINNNLRCQVSLTSLDATQTLGLETKSSPYNIHYFLRGNIEYKIQGTWTFTTVFLFRQGSYFPIITQATYSDSLDVFVPLYTKTVRLPSYNTIDLSISKIFLLTEKSTAISFISAGNIFDFKNVRGYTYNVDYTIRKQNLFSMRTVYFGIIINF